MFNLTGTVILKIPFHEEEAWEFRDSHPEGYLDMETLESGVKVVSFKRCPDLEEININNSQVSRRHTIVIQNYRVVTH